MSETIHNEKASTPPRVIVCIPAYNEEKTIAKVIIGAFRFASKVVVCDDGSTDMTSEIASNLGAIVVKHDNNLGKGKASNSLVQEVQKHDHDIVIFIDADDQFTTKEIPLLIKPIDEGEADVVIGSRIFDSKVMPRHRSVGNKVLSSMTSKRGKRVSDSQSGFRAYSSRAISEIEFKGKGMSIESQTLIDMLNRDYKIVEVPVSVYYPNTKPKRNPIFHFGEVLDYIVTRTLVDSPFVYLGFPGLLVMIIGLILGLRVVSIFYETGVIAMGSAFISVLSVIVGAVLVATSILVKLLKGVIRVEKN